MEVTIYDFNMRGDERGSLIAIEEKNDIPFSIKRVYYIVDTQPGVARGLHAHRALRQVLVCVRGNCMVLLDDGMEKMSVAMNKVSQGLLVDPMIWHEMYDFSSDCVLLVLASDFYDEKDYIRDYGEFIELVQARVR